MFTDSIETHWMNCQSSQWPRCDGCIPPSRDSEREEVDTDKEIQKAKKTYTERVGIYKKTETWGTGGKRLTN